MDFQLLKTFLHVAALGSCSKAAAALFITQSAVSRRIKQLEDHYGKPLLERSGVALRPTAAGQVLIEKARQILEIEKQLVESLGDSRSKEKISFCCTPSFGIGRLPSALNEFMAHHAETTDLKFVFDMPEAALEGVDNGRFDLALIEHCDDLDLFGFITHPLPEDEMVFISSPARGIVTGETGIERLIGERLYLKNEEGCAKRFLDKNMRTIGRDGSEFRNTVYFDDLPFIISEVLAGKGISFVSTGLVAPKLANGSLTAHRIAGFNHHRPRTLVLSRELKRSPAFAAFIGSLFASFAATPPPHLANPIQSSASQH